MNRDLLLVLRHALESAPPTAVAHLRLGTALLHENAPLEAERELRAAVALDPRCAGAWVNLGGILFARWQEVEGELGPEYTPTAVVMKLDAVRSALPGDTPVVGAAERAVQLAERERLLRARFRDADPALLEVVRRLRALERMLGRPLDVQTIDERILD